MGNFGSREIMIVQNPFYSSPLFESGFSDYGFALETKIFYLGLIWTTNGAEVIKVYVHNEILRDHLVLILADIFWAQFHLSRFNVVTSLDKSCIKDRIISVDPTR